MADATQHSSIFDFPMGRVDYVVPKGQPVFGHKERVYALPGDHIHGFRDVAGLSVTVFDGKDCRICS